MIGSCHAKIACNSSLCIVRKAEGELSIDTTGIFVYTSIRFALDCEVLFSESTEIFAQNPLEFGKADVLNILKQHLQAKHQNISTMPNEKRLTLLRSFQNRHLPPATVLVTVFRCLANTIFQRVSRKAKVSTHKVSTQDRNARTTSRRQSMIIQNV